MADLIVTAANVKPGAGASTKSGIAGEAIDPGEAVYLDPVTGKLKLAQADGAAVEAAAVGLARHAATDGQPLDYQDDGILEGMGTTEGLVYVLSGEAGKLSPHTDATTPDSTEYCTIMGVGGANGWLYIGIQASGQQVA